MWQKKICLIGDFGVGKTSLVRRFVEGRFDERYLSTLGVQITRRAVRLEGPSGFADMNLLLWDIAGDHGRAALTRQYLRGAAGAIVVCDLTRADTLDAARQHALSFRAANAAGRVVIVGNKADLVAQRCVATEMLAALAAEAEAAGFEASAKTGDNVDAFFQWLARAIMERGDHVVV